MATREGSRYTHWSEGSSGTAVACGFAGGVTCGIAVAWGAEVGLVDGVAITVDCGAIPVIPGVSIAVPLTGSFEFFPVHPAVDMINAIISSTRIAFFIT